MKRSLIRHLNSTHFDDNTFCEMCGSHLIRIKYFDKEMKWMRTQSKCIVCGPYEDIPPQMSVSLKPSFVKGKDNHLSLRLIGNIETQKLKINHRYKLQISLIDKTRGTPEVNEIISLKEGNFDLEFPLKRELGKDYHSVRCLIIGYPYIGIVRRRVNFVYN